MKFIILYIIMDYELNGWNEIENILNVIFKQHNDKTNKPSTNSTRLVKYQFLIFLFSNFVWDGKMCKNLRVMLSQEG
jgi:hypothetical protein